MDDMLGIDPDVLLEWLQTGIGDERDLQLMALEQLCMLVLITDNIDRCFESCPPRTFIPALCNIFVDETSPDNVLEVTARAITYYLDLSPECSRRIIQVDGSIKAICSRLAAAELQERSSKDFAEQCVKLLERVCQRETMAVYEAGAINAMLTLVRNHRQDVHNDTIYSAMSVVVRLCGKMEPNDPDLGKCAESLGSLLESDDAKIVESSLRCFAALTDRFIRKMMDPAELATHCNLVEHLLLTLTLSNDENSTVTSNFLSIVLSLLSNLCRGSSLITEKVLSSPNMIKGISAVLTNKEERVVTDGLRLADLLLVLLCDGRSALPATFGVSGDFNSSGGSASGTERVHRQIIDAIRQKESSVLFDAIDSGQVDVNYCDDVGQSLCNWASAFGTIEMVQFLCDKGADVNKGHKSSSLHYAACFGRADIVKLLLQKGANPDLRDEDGKTALDKARERNDEDHIRVANILESPSVYMHSDDKSRKSGESSADRGKLAKNAELPNEELVKKVLQQLLPIFCEIFQKSLNGSVRRTTLSLMRKIVQNIGDFRCNEGSEICAEAESLMAVVVSILDQEENHEGQEQVLMIIGTLLEKDPELWITELVRLGVFERVEAMAKEPAKGLEQVIMEVDKEMAPRRNSVNAPTISIDAEMPQIEDVNEDEEEEEMMEGEKMEEGSSSKSAAQTASSAILQVVSKISGGVVSAEKEKKPTRTALVENTPYRWKEWRIGRGASSVFVWSDVLLIELPLQSNGWFRYLMDNDCHMQFVSGMASVEQCENEKNAERKEIVKRWKEVKKYFDDDSYMVPIYVLGIPSSSKKLEIPGWEIWSPRSSEIQIVSTSATTPDGQPNNMTTTIKDESGGYVFESTNGRKVSMMPESALPADFHTGWSCHGLSSRKMKFRVEIQRRKVQELAWRLWNDHLKAAHAKPREALVRLEKAAMTIENAVRTARAMRVSKHKNAKQPRIERVQDLVSAMRVVHESIVDERRLSTFELSVSGIVPALFSLLSLIESAPASYPASIFKETFASGDSLSLLATKMVAVLESNERFPQYLYDTPGGSALGLQLLSRRVRAKLEYAKSDNDSQLIDKTGKALKIEPLADVAQIRAFLLKMVAKQWYDRERSTYHYVKMIQDAKEKKEPLSFRYSSDFDDQGLMYWIGTNGRSTGEWTNPASVGLVKVWCSDARQPFGKPEDILSRDTNPINCHTSDDKNASFTIDLGLMVVPSAYSLRHARGYGRSALRNWLIQGSTDRESWEVLWTHVDDAALTEPGSTATWHLKEKAKKAYRYLRIAQNGKNSSGHTYYVSISGFEIYGDVVDSVTEPLKGGDEGRKEKEQPSTSASSSDGVKTRQRASLKMGGSNALNNSGGTLSSIASGLVFGLNRLKQQPASVSTPLSRFARNSPAAGSSGNQNSSANIGKKSMSTTNLVDERQKAAAASVATTGQAASAESLQHQTPSLENLLARAMPQTFGRIAENQEEEEEQQQTSVATEDGSTTTMEEESAEKLSVSAPDLARQRKSERFKNEEEEMEEDEEDEEEEEETMDEEEEDEEEEEEEKRGTHGMYNKIRDIFVGESTSTPTSAAAASATTQPAPVQGTSKNTKKKMTSSVFRQKMSDLFRGKHPKSNLFEQAVGQMEMDEFMDEEEYYDYSEGNDDDIEMELANQLGIPPESFVSVLSGRAPPVAWKQALQFTRLVLGGRERSNRGGSSSSRGAHWEEEMLVKCNYPSLIPAYDPRPGRTNVNPTLEIELPAVVSESAQSKGGDENSPKVRLFLRGPNMTGVENVTVEMTDEQASLFKYMQMINNSVNWATKSDKSRRIWEPTYVILYANANEKCRVETSKIPTEEDTTPIQVNQCLEVIGLLSRIQQMLPEAEISPNVFISDKLTMKLTQVLNDAVVVAARAIPDWCSRLVYKFPCLFSVETRNVYMQATAFGVSRTIVWLQQRRDALIERTRGAQTANSATRQERYHEYRVGRLRHERVKITRSEEMLLDQAVRLMKFHASRKAILEIEYTNEEGTGLGPTLEFYALVAAELQRKALAIWICDDHEEQPKGEEEKEVDLGEGKKPAGYYVRRTGGLFPAPLPPHTDEVKRASEMFRVLGIFLAKVLQDGRLVDLPLSRPFLKLLVHPNVNEAELVNPEKVLSLDDFEEVNPVKGSFLKELRALAQRKRAIENEPNLDQLAKRRKIGELKLQMKGTTCRVEDLALSFTVNAPSKVFEYDEMELVDGGSEIDLTMDNIEQYVEKCEEFYLNTGILDQMRAFREGFDRVFPLRALGAYSPEEVQRLLSGEQCPEWTREDVLNYTEPKLGYTRESPGFLRFVEVMVGLSPQERKSFLQFATGCSSLPPGGLANLHPRLTIVRKIESGDGSYPSVNTCVHYLKLPEYSSADILRERLLTAVNEKGFHLN